MSDQLLVFILCYGAIRGVWATLNSSKRIHREPKGKASAILFSYSVTMAVIAAEVGVIFVAGKAWGW